ncbi:MAG: penicillin-binding protein 1C, partial [Alphaproteobacteria bacterium HGW-Alphaproteobacteria-2]
MVAPPGARIATTLDAGLQARAEALAAEAAAAQGARLSAAMLVLDHRDGAVLATVGSAGYGDAARSGFLDMTRAARSPGSALKPLIYALAFDAGIAHPETLIDDRPTDFGGYAPRNFDRAHQGTVRLRQALQASLNVPAVALLERLGPARLMASLRRAGAEPRLAGTPGLALALGGLGLTLEEVTALHAALARGGVALTPAYREEDRAEGPRLVAPRAAWYVADILAGQPTPGGGPARFAWKTGTSYGYRDAWAFGFDGRHAAGVWLGRPDGTPVPGALAAATAAPLLERLFAALGPPVPLSPPPADALTGAAPTPLATFRRPGDAQKGAPEIAFPPDGARLSPEGGRLALRLRGGIPPFTVLANGRPVATGLRWPWADLAAVGPGFLDLAVIDAAGRAARARVELR